MSEQKLLELETKFDRDGFSFQASDITQWLGYEYSAEIKKQRTKARMSYDIVRIVNLYLILFLTHLYNFFPLSIHYLQCIHCVLHFRWD